LPKTNLLKMIIWMVIPVCLAGLLAAGTPSPKGDPARPYLGQEPPGMTPEVFAPGLVSTAAWEAAGTFSPDGREFFFTRRPTWEGADNRLFHMKVENGRWTAPAPAPFARNCMEYESSISPDGGKLFFSSERPRPAGTAGRGQIWVSERGMDGWGEPRYLPGYVNSGWVMYVTAATDGTLYFTGVYDQQHGIFQSSPGADGYTKPVRLPAGVNDRRGAAHPFIAPDRSYLIFDAMDGGMADKSLFISVRQPDGSWSPARKLGPEINATRTEMCPSMSPDGKYFFFYRAVEKNGDIYWVDARIIEALRPENVN